MQKLDFKCPICGHNEYGAKKTSNGIFGPGRNSWVEYYYCSNCSVMFTDVEKFSASEKKEKEEE